MRMFPHALSIVKKDKKGKYTVYVDKGYYWSGSTSRSVSQEGADRGNSIQIVAPLVKLDKINTGDYVIKGSHKLKIESIAELEDYDYVTVVSKEVYDTGSLMIDNVIFRCQ